jgi:hypothetical protein
MAFDFKKEYREYYLPAAAPSIVTVPAMNFIAVSGTSDPNDEDGAYKRAVGMLYAVAYTIKMSKKTDRRIDGYFDFVVPPLEGFWQQTGTADIDYSRKSDFMWTSVIRLPDFVTAEDFRWAVAEAERKKKLDLSPVEFLTIEEGLCVQCMHLGSYDTEPATVALMHEYAAQQGFVPDLTDLRRHHEIYLSDPRKTVPEKLKTVIRHPVRRKEE